MLKEVGVTVRGVAAGILIACAAYPFTAVAQSSGEQVTGPPAQIDPKVTAILRAACDTLKVVPAL